MRETKFSSSAAVPPGLPRRLPRAVRARRRTRRSRRAADRQGVRRRADAGCAGRACTALGVEPPERGWECRFAASASSMARSWPRPRFAESKGSGCGARCCIGCWRNGRRRPVRQPSGERRSSSTVPNRAELGGRALSFRWLIGADGSQSQDPTVGGAAAGLERVAPLRAQAAFPPAALVRPRRSPLAQRRPGLCDAGRAG